MNYDVAVIGAGVMGAAAARALARRGRRVVMFERFRVGHDRGSSHGTSRIFRLSYPDTTYVQMALESLPLWRDLEGDVGVPLLRITGGFDVGPHIYDNARSLQECGVDFEMLDGRDASRLYPDVSVPPGVDVLFQADSGIVLAADAWSALAGSATGNGAELREQTVVRSLKPGDDDVEIHADEDTVHANVAVVTAGGWAKELLSIAGIDIAVRPTRETIAYFRSQGVLPTLVEWGEPTIYALPAPGYGLKAGEHIAGPTTDVDKTGAADDASLGRLRAWVADRLPATDPDPVHVETCIYTNTPDEHFIIERHGRIVVGSPCSGHGFKFAPLIGERLADLAER